MAKGGISKGFMWIIMGLLFVGLMGFGATNFGGSVRSVGTVGDTEIDVDLYAQALQQELRSVSQQIGQPMTLSQSQGFGLDIPGNVLGRLVAETALDDEAARLGLSVGDAEVARQVRRIPALQGLDGNFDREAYASTLQRNGTTQAEFEARLRSDRARSLLQGAVGGGVVTPDLLAHTLYAFERETRDITWARLGADDLSEEIAAPTDAEVQSFYEENPDIFTLPETRAISYVWLTPDMIVDDIATDEDALRALYEDRIAEFVQTERRLVERLVFGDAAGAEAAIARINSGEATFEAIVDERGLLLRDIDLGDVAFGQLGAAAEAVFDMTEPGVTGPHETDLGPALFRMNGILAATEVSFEDAKADLQAEFAADRARRDIIDMIVEIDDLLAGGATLEEIADETEMQLGQIDFRADVSDGIAAYPSFRQAAAAAQESDFPEIVEIDEGGVFAIRLDEIRPPALQPLDDVREEAVEAWTADATTKALSARAESIAKEIRSGREMAGLDLALNTDRSVLRSGFLEGTPPDFVSSLFDMEEGDVAVMTDELGALVVRLDTVTGADQNAPEAIQLKDAFSAQAAQGIAGDLLNAYARAVQETAGAQINQAAINAVHVQFP